MEHTEAGEGRTKTRVKHDEDRRMKIALIDVDGHNFPSLPLMKISAYHKQRGDIVAWYDPLTAWKNPPDRVYMSKVFTFTPDYPHPVNAGEVIKGGTGYSYPDGKPDLPDEIEHIFPDYHLYRKQVFVPEEKTGDEETGRYETVDMYPDTAYGFLTRGCPRGCDFCIVKSKEGRLSHKVADLSEFWNGQKNIVLLDPNFFACKDWKDLSRQLIDSNAWVDFSQGCDIRIMTKEKIGYLQEMKIKQIHFAWDQYEDKEIIVPKFEEFKRLTDWDYRKMGVYILTNFNTTIEQDLERIYILRDLGFSPYVMIFNKQEVPKGHILRRMQRWANSRVAFNAVKDFKNFK